MATKLPLVLGTDGNIQELQSGDNIQVNAGVASFTAGANLTAGDAVRISAADTVVTAQADAAGNLPAVGFATATVTSSNPVDVRFVGVVTGLSGLTAGDLYFVDPSTAGAITNTRPTTTGQLVQRVGNAKSATELLIEFGEPILLG